MIHGGWVRGSTLSEQSWSLMGNIGYFILFFLIQFFPRRIWSNSSKECAFDHLSCRGKQPLNQSKVLVTI